MLTLIKNAHIVLSDTALNGNIVVENEYIKYIGADTPGGNYNNILDASGLTAIPGMIDDQVHFREPGLTHKADIETESKAAAAGGITSFMEMPNTNPQTITLEALDNKHELAALKSAVNYSFYLGATNNNIEAIKQVDVNKTCGIKVFMGSSTGNMLVDNIKSLQQIFAESPILIATHCEDEGIIKANMATYKKKFGDDIAFKYHPLIRSAEACYKSSALAVELAVKYQSRLHILHLSTARELDLFEKGTIASKRITSEVCIHHLTFCDDDYNTYGSKIKWNPAVKSMQDREALIQALREDKLDVLATDHAPHTIEEKQQSYFKAPSGGPLVQHALVAALELVNKGHFNIHHLIKKTSIAPAQLYQVHKRGELKEGNYADIVLYNPNEPWKVSKGNILYKCGWSPFEGKTFKSKIKYTLVNGKIVYRDGDDNIPLGNGMPLEFKR